MDGLTRANSPLSCGETNRASTASDAAPVPYLTSGQSVQKSVRAFLKMLLGLFQTADVENLIELRHHAPNVIRGKPQFSIA